MNKIGRYSEEVEVEEFGVQSMTVFRSEADGGLIVTSESNRFPTYRGYFLADGSLDKDCERTPHDEIEAAMKSFAARAIAAGI